MRLVILFVLLAACGAGTSTTDCSTLPDTWANYGSTFFTSNCRSCHQHTNQYGTQASVLATEAQISSEISAGKMPEGTSLTAADKARVLAWLSCGAP